jgi:2-polyprenyl-3-methyl-5-hydroxy-6-metoxy-1,4-benzoquinol methylase
MNNDVYERYKDYDKVFAQRHLKYPFVTSIKKQLSRCVKGNVLDIGTGDGYKLNYILSDKQVAQRVTSVTVTEPSQLINSARLQLSDKNVTFFPMDYKDFFCRNTEKFDTILAFEIIEHIEDQTEFLNNIKNSLTSEGVFICSTPNHAMYRLLCKLSKEKPDPTHVSELTAGEFKQKIRKRFSHTSFKGFFPFMGLFQKIPQLDIVNYIYPLSLSRTIYCFASESPLRLRAITE